MDRPRDGAPVEEIGFLLLPQFPIYALILALEALRIANQCAGRRLFRTPLFSLDGRPVRATNGMELRPDRGIAAVPFCPTVIVVAGNEPLPHLSRALLGWLRRLDRHGATLGAIDTGAFALARAGLLDGAKVAVHWEAIPLFREHFPEVEPVEQLYTIERNRLTCAGGIATLDWMHELIARRAGRALAETVRAGLVHKRARAGAEPQHPPHPAQPGPTDRRLEAAIALIERQLERVTEARFGRSPREFRRQFSGDRLERFRPEVCQELALPGESLGAGD